MLRPNPPFQRVTLSGIARTCFPDPSIGASPGFLSKEAKIGSRTLPSRAYASSPRTQCPVPGDLLQLPRHHFPAVFTLTLKAAAAFNAHLRSTTLLAICSRLHNLNWAFLCKSIRSRHNQLLRSRYNLLKGHTYSLNPVP